MFRITCMVDDKNLAKALVGLAAAGAYDVVPTPVANAQKGVAGIIPKSEGKMADIVYAELPDSLKEVSRQQVTDIMTKHGFAAGSVNYTIQQLIKAKKLKLTKKRAVYGVVR